jgi:hypothetical protein
MKEIPIHRIRHSGARREARSGTTAGDIETKEAAAVTGRSLHFTSRYFLL